MKKYKVTFENDIERKTFFVKADIKPQMVAWSKLVSKYGAVYAHNICSCIRVREVL